jgi:DNA polymerase
MTTIRIDLETYSSVDLRKCGVHKYVESPDFQIMLFGYKWGTGQVNVIDLMAGEEIPAHVLAALDDPKILKTAYNAAFELACLNLHLGRKLDVTQWRCTSVHALYLGLPGNLADVGRVVGLSPDKQKMSVGWSLIRFFCIPCKPTKKNGARTRNLPQHDPAKWQLFKDYCGKDVESEDAIAARLAKFPVPEIEWTLWHLDHRMMTRGVLMDRVLVHAAIECDAIFKERMSAEAIKLTGLDNPNSRNQLLAWLQEEEDDDTIVDLTKKTVPAVLANTDSDVVRRVLELRQEMAKTSVAKFHAMARAMCSDGCIRGLTQFYGANRTGRWAGRIVQVQNLPQNKLKDLELARNLVKVRQFNLLETVYGTVPDTLSQLIRTAFIARPGARFISVDFSAIEARVIAWLAWCEWRLEVFATHGKIYEASAEQMFKLPPGSVTKKSPYRQKGKISELALGYQGGAGALKTMGALAMGLTEEELDPIKEAWRAANPEIASFDSRKPGLWLKCDNAAKKAVQTRADVVVPIANGQAHIVFAFESGFLTVKLPSKRKLFYVKPRIEGEDLYRETSAGGRFMAARAGSLTYEGLDQKTKQWTRLSTYGGKLVENITQAIARDCLREAMLALDKAGHEQLFTVHDEIIVEARDIFDLAKVEGIMGQAIPWAPGLLLRADGFETPYYMKEID